MNIDSCILQNISEGTPWNDIPLVQITWAAFMTPGPIWNRDFCWLQYVTGTKDSRGRDAAVCACESIDFDQCQDLQKSHSFVRGAICTTGYIYTEIEGKPNDVMITYVVQVDPKGAIPKWVVNLVASEQGENAGRVRDSSEEICTVTDKFNDYMQNMSGSPRKEGPIANVEIQDVLIYAGNTETRPFKAEESGILEVHLVPRHGATIDFNGKDYTNDPSSARTPLFETEVTKGETVDLTFKNKSSGFSAKFKHVFYYVRVRPQQNDGFSDGNTISAHDGKGQKSAWTPWKKKKKPPEAPIRVKFVEKKVVVEVHLEKQEERAAWRKGFVSALSVVLFSVVIKFAAAACLDGGGE
jgi:hypothetical protein